MSRRLAPSIILAAALFLLPFACGAQSAGSDPLGLSQQPVQYVVTPQVPGPNTQVTIQVQGVGNFLGDSQIAWTLNGKAASSGVGDNSFSFTTGDLGSPSAVAVEIDTQEYGVITQSWTFDPSLVNLVWEANTTVPPFYMGHALYSAGSQIKVAAFPDVIVSGARVPDSKLSFQWTLDNTAEPNQSGLGRDTFTFNGNQLRGGEDVSLSVLADGISVASGDLTVPATAPELVLYQHDPLRGILYNQAIPNSFAMSADEVTVHAEPYFFSRGSAAGNGLVWNWTLNGAPTTGPNSSAGELTLRTQNGGAGQAALAVSLQSTGTTNFLEAAQAALSITFGATSTGSIFGI